jgi:hypothetical protein
MSSGFLLRNDDAAISGASLISQIGSLFGRFNSLFGRLGNWLPKRLICGEVAGENPGYVRRI